MYFRRRQKPQTTMATAENGQPCQQFPPPPAWTPPSVPPPYESSQENPHASEPPPSYNSISGAIAVEETAGRAPPPYAVPGEDHPPSEKAVPDSQQSHEPVEPISVIAVSQVNAPATVTAVSRNQDSALALPENPPSVTALPQDTSHSEIALAGNQAPPSSVAPLGSQTSHTIIAIPENQCTPSVIALPITAIPVIALPDKSAFCKRSSWKSSLSL